MKSCGQRSRLVQSDHAAAPDTCPAFNCRSRSSSSRLRRCFLCRCTCCHRRTFLSRFPSFLSLPLFLMQTEHTHREQSLATRSCSNSATCAFIFTGCLQSLCIPFPSSLPSLSSQSHVTRVALMLSRKRRCTRLLEHLLACSASRLFPISCQRERERRSSSFAFQDRFLDEDVERERGNR